VIVEGEGVVLGVNLGHPIVTNGDLVTWPFPNYFGQDLLTQCQHVTTAIASCIIVHGLTLLLYGIGCVLS